MRASKPRATPKIVAADESCLRWQQDQDGNPQKKFYGDADECARRQPAELVRRKQHKQHEQERQRVHQERYDGMGSAKALTRKTNACRSGVTAASLPVGCSCAGPFSSRSRNRAW